MTTKISLPIDTPVFLSDDDLVITSSGSVFVDNPVAALTLEGPFTAGILGDVSATSAPAISATMLPGDTISIGPTALIHSDADGAGAIELDGSGASLLSAGTISSTGTGGAGIKIFADTIAPSIGNAGFIGGEIGIFGVEGTRFMLTNSAKGTISGTDAGIAGVGADIVNRGTIEGDGAGIRLTGGLDLSNRGTISGGIFVDGTAPIESSHPPGIIGSREWWDSTIDNRGVIEGDGRVAIDFGGKGADVVANRGVIDGAVVLGGGNDEYFGGGETNGWVLGQGGADRLRGGEGDDSIHGGTGSDRIAGRGGDDYLIGGYGVDSISGGAGDDTIRGSNARILTGEGDDLVIYQIDDRRTVISDFEPGHDKLDLSDFADYNLPDYDALLATATERPRGLVFDLRAGIDTVTLVGLTLADISEDDFIL